MLQINTPGGFFVVREKDVADNVAAQMVWKAILKNPKGYHGCNSDYLAEGMIACLNGEPGSTHGIFNCLDPIEVNNIADIRAVLDSLYLRDHQKLELIGDDGVTKCAVNTLRKHFQLVDDYLEDNPQETGIKLPFSNELISGCIYPTHDCALIDFYEALCHLNPKSNIYCFQFNLKDFPITKVLELASRFTEEEIDNIIDYVLKLGNKHLKLPSRKVPYILSAFDSVRNNTELMKAIYVEKYPSYLFCVCYKTIWSEEKSEYWSDAALALLTWDFSIDQDMGIYDALDAISAVLMVTSVRTRSGKRALKSFIKRHKLSFPTVLPYGVTLP